jgi:hypothetical protein
MPLKEVIMARKLWDWLEDDENFKLVTGCTWVLMLLFMRWNWMRSSGDPVEQHPLRVGPLPLPPPSDPLTWSERLAIVAVAWVILLVVIAPALPALWTLFRRLRRYQKARRT